MTDKRPEQTEKPQTWCCVCFDHVAVKGSKRCADCGMGRRW